MITTVFDRVNGVSAIGIVDKQRSGFVKHRLVHDLSRPDGASTNEHAQFDSRRFPTVRTAMKLIRPGMFLAKIDISEYYRNFPMAHRHWADLAFKWKVYGEDVARVLVETRMPFGLSSAPSIADRLTQAVVRLMRSKGYTVVGYLDDFLVVGVTEERCREAYEFLLFLLRDLGFPVNEDKCEPPTQELVFLGIQLSTVGQCTASVDEARVRHVVEMITGVLSDVRVKASRLQSLLGLLTFVS